MANQKQLVLLKKGVGAWNRWRADSAAALSEPDGKIVYAADLRASDLSGKQLSGVNFGNVNLAWSNLARTQLENANFTEAELAGVNFTGAHLSGASFHNANLSGAHFRNADLHNVDCSRSDLWDADFRDASLQSVDFSCSDLDGANFQGADLSGANLSRCSLMNVDFTGATLNGTNFYHATHLSIKTWRSAKATGAVKQRPDNPVIAGPALSFRRVLKSSWFSSVNRKRARFLRQHDVDERGIILYASIKSVKELLLLLPFLLQFIVVSILLFISDYTQFWLLLCSVGGTIFFIVRFIRFLQYDQPVLIVDDTGIQYIYPALIQTLRKSNIWDLPWRNMKLTWKEIGAIGYIKSGLSYRFAIYSVAGKQQPDWLPALELPQILFSMPIKRIVAQIQQQYQSQLERVQEGSKSKMGTK